MIFKQLKINDHKEINDFVRRYQPYSDFNFVSLLTWGVNNSSFYTFYEDTLYIKLRDYMDNSKYTYSILGNKNLEKTVEAFFDLKLSNQLELVPRVVTEQISNARYEIVPQRDEYDYVYNIADLITMQGPAYRRLRRSLSNFHSKSEFKNTFRLASEVNSELCEKILNLTKKWRTIRGRKYADSASEYFAVRRALRFYKQLDIKIWILESESRLIGYVITENYGETAIIHFEKCDTTIPGVGSYMKHRVLEELRDLGCTMMNYEQDLGLPGLREQKESLAPDHFLEKFTVTLRR